MHPSTRICIALALLVSACDPTPADPADAFVGVWNYDHPALASGFGIATLECPASDLSPPLSLLLPQIGWLSFERTGPDRLDGTTDQGCAWTFSVEDDVATIDPVGQSCFNANIGSSYTITAWTVALGDDGHASESLSAVSHHEVDCAFELTDAARTRFDPSAGDLTAPFVGTWLLDPPDAQAGSVAVVTCPDAAPSYVPQVGALTIVRVDDDTIAITTEAGCTSTLDLRDHTAELATPAASCDGGPVPSFWSFETDGMDAFQTQSGALDGCAFVLSNSHLVRSPA